MSEGLAVVLAENIYENLELHYPRLRLQEAGFDVKVAAPEKGATYTSKEGYPVVSHCKFSEIDPKAVKVLVVPGGYAPDKMRRYPECNKLVAEAWNAGAVVAFVCHGGWVPISARIVKGKRLTSVGAIRDDLENAGAIWVNEPCVVDGRMVTAQLPKDLPAMMAAVLKLAAQSK
ncbi:MAG TPA: type 1 glutamine amidotransferase domain-containing protein [Planctomycetota bacterium]|nr:type 1 glutamine amidotransferase domain-containing protein [Planctomycetota bacterium]